MIHAAKCLQCGARGVRPQRGPGRLHRFRNTNLYVPSSLELSTCLRCGRQVHSQEENQALLKVLNTEYQIQLSERAVQALASLRSHISKRRLEILVDLSQGYLSKVSASAQAPSAVLVSLLVLLAADPKRLLELEHYWLIPIPQQESK